MLPHLGVCCPAHSKASQPRQEADISLGKRGYAGPGGDTQTFDGFLVGADKNKDLCVLQIRPPPSVLSKLRPAALGTSKDLRVGQAVNALGNPFGFDHTLTTGAVLARASTSTASTAVQPRVVKGCWMEEARCVIQLPVATKPHC